MRMRKRKLPRFLRQEWFRYRRLGEKWRRPKGKDSKRRLGLKGRAATVKVGYRNPGELRGLHPSGLREVLVSRPEELEGLNPSAQAVRISAGVGGMKRAQILSRARELGLRVLNPGRGTE